MSRLELKRRTSRFRYHYSIPVRPLFKSYPVYHPAHEPAGYWRWLNQQEPQIIWNEQGARPKLETQADWIKAGELVYDEPIDFLEAGDRPFVRDPPSAIKALPGIAGIGIVIA